MLNARSTPGQLVRRSRAAVVAALVTAVLGACGSGAGSGTASGTCILAVQQGLDSDRADQYADLVDQAMVDCATDGATDVRLVPITDATATESKAAVDVAFEDRSGGNQTNARRAHEKAAADAEEEIRAELLAPAPAGAEPGADIMGVGSIAARELPADDSVRRLVIVADAWDAAIDLPRTGQGAAAEKAIGDQVRELAAEGVIPALSGVEVRMLGVLRGDRAASLTPAQRRDVEAFWQAYWTAADAELTTFE